MKNKMSALSDETLRELLAQSSSLTELSRKIGYKTKSGAIFQTIKNEYAYRNISLEPLSHKHSKRIERTVDNIFIKNSTADQKTLRKWYVEGAYTEYKCAICGQEPFWNGKKLTLTLDHINGNNKDDRLENLRWICPNCDRQLDTFGAKNIKAK